MLIRHGFVLALLFLVSSAWSAVTSEVSRTDYVGNGSVAAYATTFPVKATSEVRVFTQDADGQDIELSLGADYSATLNAAGLCTVTLTAGNLTNDYKLSLQRGIPYTQTYNPAQSGAYNAASLGTALDRLAMEVIRLKGDVARSIKIPYLEAGGDSVTKLADDAATRANQALVFDSSGNAMVGGTVGVSASAFAQTLLDDTTASEARDTLGLGDLSVLDTLPLTSLASQAARTVIANDTAGAAIPTTRSTDDLTVLSDGSTTRWDLSSRFARVVYAKDHGALGDGTTDDRAAISAAVTAAGPGGVVVISGGSRIASTLTITTRVSLWCNSATDYILVDVGAGNNGIVYTGGAAGINGLDIKLNVYGRATACLNAVFLTRVDRSRIFLDVYAGAASYGVVLDGCLINRIHIESTANKIPPISSPALQVDHVLVQKNTTYSTASNVNDIWVNLEGARHGYTQSAMSGEGNNYLRGCIEGLSGRALTVTTANGWRVSDLHLEANATASTIDAIQALSVGPAFMDADSLGVVITNCRGSKVDGYFGKLTIDSTNSGTKLGQVCVSAIDGLAVSDPSAVVDCPVAYTSTALVMPGGPGDAVMENVFHNPFIDIWTAGAVAAPDGYGLTNATIARATATPFPGNASKVYGVVTQTGTAIGDGITAAIKENPATDSDWMGVMIPIRIPAGQQNVRVWVLDGSQYNLIGYVTTRDEWTVVRGAVKTINGNSWTVRAVAFNGTSYVAGTFWVGGCSIVKGSHPPRHLCDNGQRLQHVVTSVSNTPAFVGQRAYLSGTGKWYMAAGVASSADWIILN